MIHEAKAIGIAAAYGEAYQCRACGRYFKRTSDRNRHETSWHAGAETLKPKSPALPEKP